MIGSTIEISIVLVGWKKPCRSNCVATQSLTANCNLIYQEIFLAALKIWTYST